MNESLREKAIRLRKTGLTYSLIQRELGVKIPKGTLGYWLKDIKLSSEAKAINKKLATLATLKSRSMAVAANKLKRQQYLDSIINDYQYLQSNIKNRSTALIALAMIYLGEGAKAKGGSTAIGNSDPNVIKLYLYLLNQCFDIDKHKFRCTVMCRADQNIKELEKYWSDITKLPLSQFYKTRVDIRTIGKPSRKKDYKGVLNLEYFSAHTYNVLMSIIKIIVTGL